MTVEFYCENLGLKELTRRAKPNECPFCGEPRAPTPMKLNPANGKMTQHGRQPVTCGSEECKKAYGFYWRRDQQHLAAAERAQAALALRLAALLDKPMSRPKVVEEALEDVSQKE